MTGTRVWLIYLEDPEYIHKIYNMVMLILVYK